MSIPQDGPIENPQNIRPNEHSSKCDAKWKTTWWFQALSLRDVGNKSTKLCKSPKGDDAFAWACSKQEEEKPAKHATKNQ